tara:strand:- start:1099 stop:2022 length:924 start_codon:yes stop_codon:yes gene_type:complete
MKSEPLQIQWIKHISAENNERGSNPKDIIENVSLSAAEGIRGDLTGKEYVMADAIKMNEKYDRLADAGYFRRDPHINKLSATDAVIANATGTDAARYHRQDPELLKHYKGLRIKRAKILNDIKKEKLRKAHYSKAWGVELDPAKMHNQDLKKNIRRWNKEADDEKLENLKIFEGNINNKKKIKIASKPKPNGYDSQPNVIPIGPIPHEKPWYEDMPDDDDAAYRFKFPAKEKYTVLDKINLYADLREAADANSGIGRYDKRKRLASGSEGSTSKLAERVREIYGIQLTGYETYNELLELMRRLDAKE